jgi:hypothetical protein
VDRIDAYGEVVARKIRDHSPAKKDH